MTRICIDKGAVSPCDCKNFMKGIRTINGQYPDDNREFGILEGAGILITPETAGIRVTCTIPTADTIVAGDNIDISPGGDNELVISLVTDPEISGDLQVNGTTLLNDDLQVNGDIIQNGASYETHAEKVYTTNDYIITRDGAISALSPGDYSGFQVKKYDGTNDGRLVMDKDGVARVGDVGDEQPLLTRDESGDLTDQDIFVWDATDQKAIGTSKSTLLSDRVINIGGAVKIETEALANTGGTVNFSTPFTNVPNVSVTSRDSTHGSWIITLLTVSNTGFTFSAKYSTDMINWYTENNVVITYIAVGN